MVLPEIVRVIGGRIPIFVDCGVMNGTDAFKCLAWARRQFRSAAP